jgi:adenosylcobinamide-phosphate synthase
MMEPKRTPKLVHRWGVMVLALLLDHAFGDLPNRWHPVAWMGALISFARRYAPNRGSAAQFLYGATVVLSGALLTGVVGQGTTSVCGLLPRPFSWLLEAFLLKQTVALHGLAHAAEAVATPLALGDEIEARHQLSWHLVSRDTSALDATRIAAATIESVAENASDGVIAPLVTYVAMGLPGAFVYRWLNTVDALWGYRDPAREWLGKAGARADDVANLVPARLTAALLLAAAALFRGKSGQAWRVWQRDAHLTASPNAGHPMSAMAGALGVELEKVGHYRLGEGLTPPNVDDIHQAVTLIRAATVVGVVLSGVVSWIWHCGEKPLRKPGTLWVASSKG